MPLSRLTLALVWVGAGAQSCDESTCSSNQPWTTKCGWGKCKACDQCQPPSPPPLPPGIPVCDTRYIGTSGYDTNGDSLNSGCDPATPLQTLTACVSLSSIGDSCLFLPGRYFVDDIAGVGFATAGKASLTVANAPQEVWPSEIDSTEVILDGTLQLSGWEALSDAHGTYYKSADSFSADGSKCANPDSWSCVPYDVWQVAIALNPLKAPPS